MVNRLLKPIVKLIANSALFVCGIILTVGISTMIAVGAPPTVGIPNFKSFTIGRAPGDNYGVNIFGNEPYGFFEIDYRDSAAPSGAAYAADVNSNKAGTTVSGYNIGVLGQSKQNSAGNFGRVGVVGQVITPAQGVGRGILGFLEPTSPPPAAFPSNAIPTYAPIASGNLYGLYADAGESRFGNVTVDGTITSTDGKTEFEGPTEFLDELTVNGTVTADKFVLNPSLYKNSATVDTGWASSYLENSLNKMLFTVTSYATISISASAAKVQSSVASCPAGSVRISCHGRVSDTNDAASAAVGYSNYRGTMPDGANGCRSYAQKTSGGKVHVEAICMAAELP